MIIVGNNAFSQQYSQFHQSLLDRKRSYFHKGMDFQQPELSSTLPGNYYCTQLGYFCKKEMKVESLTKIPFRFRLGSLQYNDWMEGKKNTSILQVK
jgi:hypothetical protein